MERETERSVRVNGLMHAVSARTLVDLLRELGHDPERPGIAVALNDEVIPRGMWAARDISDGDRIEIVGAVQGG